MWQAVSVATGGLAGYRGYDTPRRALRPHGQGPVLVLLRHMHHCRS